MYAVFQREVSEIYEVGAEPDNTQVEPISDNKWDSFAENKSAESSTEQPRTSKSTSGALPQFNAHTKENPRDVEQGEKQDHRGGIISNLRNPDNYGRRKIVNSNKQKYRKLFFSFLVSGDWDGDSSN